MMHSNNNNAYDYDCEDEVGGGFLFFHIVFDEPVQDYIPERLLGYIKLKNTPETIVLKHKSAAERYEALEQLKVAAYKAQVARADEKTREIKERTKLAQAQAKRHIANDIKWHCEKRSILLESKKQKLKSYHKKLRNRVEIVKYSKFRLKMADGQQQGRSQIRERAGSDHVALAVASHTSLNRHEGLRVRTIYIDDGNYGCQEFVGANKPE